MYIYIIIGVCSLFLLRYSYYYVFKHRFSVVEMEIEWIEEYKRKPELGKRYICGYKYEYKGKKKKYICVQKGNKEVGEQVFLIDPVFGMVFKNEMELDFYAYIAIIFLVGALVSLF